MKSSRRLRFTAERWGTRQRDLYDARLNRALRSLLGYPELGPPRDDLFPGCRNLLVEQHVLFYRIDGEEIVLGRVLHSSQNPAGKITP